MTGLSGKVVLVTGGSRGLGRSIALGFGRAGAAVAVTDILLEEESPTRQELASVGRLGARLAGGGHVKTRETASEIERMGSPGMALKLDVTSLESITRAVREIEDTLGSIDILVNNAAVMDNLALLGEQDPQRWEHDIRVNLSGAFHCTKAVWPKMIKKGWGRVINVSSFVGLMGAFAQPSYGASKAGLIGLTRTLALEGAKHGITVNAVLPGFIETEAVRLHDPHIIERIRKRTAVKRLGKPEEVAAVVAFLASDAASYVTGAAIPITGGADLFVF